MINSYAIAGMKHRARIGSSVVILCHSAVADRGREKRSEVISGGMKGYLIWVERRQNSGPDGMIVST